jgi:hypothetical protein
MVTVLVTLISVACFCMVLAIAAFLVALVNHDITWKLAIGIPTFLMYLCPLVVVSTRMSLDLRPLTRLDQCVALIGSLCAPLLFLTMFQYLVATFSGFHLSKEATFSIIFVGIALGLIGAARVYKPGLVR